METTAAVPGERSAALLKQALDHLNRDEIVLGEAALNRILAEDPENADALQLLGLIRRRQGAEAEAEQLYRRSLASRPDQPHVHHNLGNLYRTQRRYDEAIAEQREAIRLKSNYAEAWFDLGMAQTEKGEYDEAEKSLRRALHIVPNFLAARQALGATLNDMGRARDAETLMRQTLAMNPRNPRDTAILEHNLAISLKLQDRYDDALKLFDSAQARVPDLPLADYNRANTLQQMGRLEEALFCYRRALAGDPLDMLAHRDMNHLLYRLGRDEDFLRSYDDVMALYPDVDALPLAKADFLFMKEDFAAAGEYYERAARLAPGSVKPHDGLGMVLARAGDFEAAIARHEMALRLEPQNAHALRNFAETLIRAGDAKKALEAAEKARAIEPNHQAAIAIWSVAAELAGDPRAGELNDFENFVQVFELEPPAGFDSMEHFNADLNAYLDALHRDKREVVDQTLRGGTQTQDDLFGKRHAPVEALRARIDQAIKIYIGRMKENADHPLLRRKRAGFKYSSSWSSRLSDCGFHINHVHPKGWISSAYYVAVPDAVSDEKEKQGWIKFGEPYFDAGLKNPIRRSVQPKPGTLVLFPSYMWHGTIPFRSREQRTTIAFDAVPA
ncbi:MAG TPA: tetratricopeptide repeat protein [Rhizomicrobium sp.]|nr:tetratricopeptide repeat protein [Rhizomicrobium sp.]